MAYENTPENNGPWQQPEAPPRREPFLTAPLIVVVMGLALIALYALYAFAPFDQQEGLLYDFALAPERFWAPAGSPKVYPDVASALLTTLSTALLHGGWVHVLVNSFMLMAFGAPVARALGTDPFGMCLWMLVFVVSIVAGSALYLALADQTSPYAVGASGGTSGLMGAMFLLGFDGRRHRLWSREFLTMSGAFALANVALAMAGPFLIGSGIAWQAHAGGYIAGAVLMSVLPLRGQRVAQS